MFCRASGAPHERGARYDTRDFKDSKQTFEPIAIASAVLTVGVRDVGPQHVVLAVHHLVHLFAVPQQFEVHETRLVPGRETCAVS